MAAECVRTACACIRELVSRSRGRSVISSLLAPLEQGMGHDDMQDCVQVLHRVFVTGLDPVCDTFAILEPYTKRLVKLYR